MTCQTKTGLLLLIIGLVMGIISTVLLSVVSYFESGLFMLIGVSFVSGIGGLIALVGGLLMVIGRKEFGEKHSRFVVYAVVVWFLSIIVTVVITAVISGLAYMNVASGSIDSSQLSSNIANASLIVAPIAAGLGGLVYILLLYNLENEVGRRLLYVAVLVSVVLSVIIAYNTTGEIEELTDMTGAEGYQNMWGSISDLSSLSILGVIGSVLYLVALYIPYKRIASGELVSIQSESGMSRSDRICPNCKRKIPFDAATCPYCGKQFQNYL